MQDSLLFDQARFARVHTLAVAADVTEQAADVIPPGFRNNIRWNLGHVLVTTELMICRRTGNTPDLPAGYQELFANGTSPADWKGAAPTLNELRFHLQSQPARIEALLAGRLGSKLTETWSPRNVFAIETVAQLLNFSTYHEATHIGFIKGLVNVVGAAK